MNKNALRRLYNIGNKGSGTAGKKTRYDFHATVTYPTYIALTQTVPVGQGGYGSSVIELSIRILLTLIGRLDPTVVSEELTLATLSGRSTVTQNLRKMADLIDNYSLES